MLIWFYNKKGSKAASSLSLSLSVAFALSGAGGVSTWASFGVIDSTDSNSHIEYELSI